MEAVKKYFFWILICLVILGAGAFWVLAVLLRQAGVEELRNRYKTDKGRLADWAGSKARDVKTPRDIKALQSYVNSVRKVRGAIEQHCSRSNIDIRSEVFMPPPPRTDLPRFQIWIEEQYRKREMDAKSRNEELALQKDPERPHLIGDFRPEFITPENMDLVLKRLVMTSVVQRILSMVQVEVPFIRLNLDTDKEEVVQGIRRVEVLKRMEFLSLAEADSRRPKIRTSGASEKWRTPPPFPEPFRRHVFELEFVAHYSVVPQVIKMLMETRTCYLLVTRADLYRHPQVFREETGGGPPTRGLGAEAATLSPEQQKLINTRYREAPMVVLLECEVLEFDFPDDETAAKTAK